MSLAGCHRWWSHRTASTGYISPAGMGGREVRGEGEVENGEEVEEKGEGGAGGEGAGKCKVQGA